MKHSSVLIVVALLTACKDAGPDGPEPLRDSIVFVSDRTGATEIYVMPRTGGKAVQLTLLRQPVFAPQVSPDGSAIAFVCAPQICTMRSDGSELTRLPASGSNGSPSWSPDGRRLAFSSDRDGNLELYAMDADGSNVVRLTNDPAQDLSPAWSPDGTRIAFGSDRGSSMAGQSQVFVMNADGSGVTNLSNSASSDYGPHWSHDGRSLSFGSDRTGHNGIVLMDADGGNQRPVGPAGLGVAEWSPDDRQFVTNTVNRTISVIATLDTSGANYLELTAGQANDRAPSFSP